MNLFKTLSLTVLAAFASAVPAQIDRESEALVPYQHLRHAALTDIQALSAQGYRLSNFEISSQTPFELNCSMLRNQGVYQAGWYFFADKSRAELLALCNNHNARIVDLERYEVNGVEKLAALLFVNSGQQQKNWAWHTAIPQGSLWNTINGLGKRIIDLEPYYENGAWYYHVISIANQGADEKDWWVYTNTTVAGVQGYMAQHNARLYDFEMKSLIPYSCACVLVEDDLTDLTSWGEFYGSGFNLDDERGGRVAVLATQNIGSHVVTLINNRNPFITHGLGCVGTHGLSIHRGAGTAMTGTQITYTADHLWPWTIAIQFYGTSTTWVPLAGIGAPGCSAYLVPFTSTAFAANGNGIATTHVNVPNNPALQGVVLTSQVAALDPGLNQLGLQFSDALVTTLRHW